MYVLENMDAETISRKRYEDTMRNQYQKEVDKNPSHPLTLHDFKRRMPFEQFMAQQRERMPAYRKMWHERQRANLAEFGVLCLCRNGESAAMWAHYAKNHEGFLLEFDENHDFFQQFKVGRMGEWIEIEYRDERPIWDYEKEKGSGFLKFKSAEWRYENETRLAIALAMHPNTGADDKGIKCLVTAPADAITSVTIGLRTEVSVIAELEKASCAPEMKHVRRLHASVDEKVYRLNRDAGFER